jgi:putative ABC transport system permease protein
MFKARTSRTLLTILGMSIGIGAILFLVSFGYGLQETLKARITTSESLLTLDITEAKAGIVSLDGKMIESIEKTEGVVEVSPSARLIAQGLLGDISADLSVNSIKPSFLRLGGTRISDGETLDDANPEGVVIASAVAQVFGKKEATEMIGQEISFVFFRPKKTEVGGEELQSNLERIDLDKKYKIIGVTEEEDSVIYVNSNSLGDLRIDNFIQAKVKCSSQQAMGLVRDSILNQGLLVSSLSDIIDQANTIFYVIQWILGVFGFIALGVSAIGMFNTMTIALLERTEEIGIMKSIGASDGTVSMMFITESTIMGFLGGISGVIIGLTGGYIFNFLINLLASHYGGQAVSLFYSPSILIILVIISAAVVGFFTGVVPARRASKIDPLDALRYK